MGIQKKWGPNKFWVQQNFLVQQNLGPKYIKFTKILGQEKFSAKNILVPKNFWLDLSYLTNLNLAWPVITWFAGPNVT